MPGVRSGSRTEGGDGGGVKLLLDENLSVRLIEVLADLYPGTDHVHRLGLGASGDDQVWSHAKLHGFAVVSKDSDFADRSVLEGAPPKVIWIRIGNCTTTQIEKLLRANVAVIRSFLEEDRETCLVLGRR